MKKVILVSFLFLFLSQVNRAQDNGSEILEALKLKMELVENYSADVNIKVDVVFIKIKERSAKISYTKPNQFDLKADGFMLLPKKGMEMDYLSVINEGYTCLLIKEEIVNGVTTSLIKVIPDNMEGDLILAEMWIDPLKSTIHKMRSYSKKAGTYTINIFYADHPFDLPDSVVVEFEVKNGKIPVAITGDFEALDDVAKKDEKSSGKVIIKYSNYVVNLKEE
jgi:hypothetical protein